jgi:glycosyltransferase involved in cell wall biosynthesis
MSKPSLAIVRGYNLNKFQMQTYELLSDNYKITAYTTHNHFFNIDTIKVPIKKLHCLEEYTNPIPYPFHSLVIFSFMTGYNHHLFGLENDLKHYDIANVEEVFNGYTFQAITAKKKHDIKVVVNVWENIPFRPACTLPDFIPVDMIAPKLLDNIRARSEVINQADLFIAITERAQQALILEGVSKHKIKVVPMGIDLNTFKPELKNQDLLSKLGLREDEFIILFIGRLVREKGIYDLLYAAKIIAEDKELNNKNIRFVLVGDGPEKNRLRQQIQKLELSHKILLVGNYPYSEIPKLYNLANIFVLPSLSTRWWQEQFGMVIVEAFASGIPVISTFSGSLPEVVDDAGILIQPNDPFSLYQSIKKLIQNEPLRLEFKEKGIKRARDKYDRAKVAQQLNECYQEILSH